MSDYTKSTNFATKDSLSSGNPLKIVKGTEINTEFDNIQTAVATKADLASPTFTGTPSLPTGTTATTQSSSDSSTKLATTAFVKSAIGTIATQNANSVTITGGTIDGTSVGATTASTVRGSTITATTQFSGPGTGLTGTASSLSIGGNAATATSATSATTATNVTNGLGVSQTYQNVTGSRSSGTTYTNSTSKPIWVWYSATSATSGATTTAYVDGNLACYTSMDLYPRAFAGFIVPSGSTYVINCGGNLAYWLELR